MNDYNPRHRRGRPRTDPTVIGLAVGVFIGVTGCGILLGVFV